MPRPMLDERMTVRMPGKLLAVILDRAARTNCSANHVVLSSLEHDFARMDTYSLDYYVDILPLVEDTKARIVTQLRGHVAAAQKLLPASETLEHFAGK